MEPIPIFRTAHLLPYLELLDGIGAPVERGLHHARLPTMVAAMVSTSNGIAVFSDEKKRKILLAGLIKSFLIIVGPGLPR